MSSFRIADYYGSDVKLVCNGNRGFTGKLFPNGNRKTDVQSAGANGSGSGGNGTPEKGRRITKKTAGKIQRQPSHKRFDNVRGDELLIINRKGNRRTFERASIISHQWNDMHNGTHRLQLNIEVSNE